MSLPARAVGGIYAIRNLLDQKLYVGSAMFLERRKKEHFQALRGGYHFNRHLQCAWRRDGEANFVFEVLEIVPDRADLIAREQYYIDSLRAYDDSVGYNLRRKAESNLGIKFSPEAVAKNRAARFGKKRSEEAKRLTSQTMKGCPKTAQHAENIAAAKRGVSRPAEMVEQLAKKFRRFDEQQVGSIKALRGNGKTYAAIAREFGCTESTIHRVINGVGLAYR